MRVAIVGTGAVGAALGSCLYEAGHQTVFIGRPTTRGEPFGGRDLKRMGILGEVTVPREDIQTANSLEEADPDPFDYVLLCTKTTANPEIRSRLEVSWKQLRTQPWFVICQNGWGNAEFFAEKLPRERIANARILTGFRKPDIHTVEVTVHGDPIQIGSLFRPETRELEALCEAIQSGGIPCQSTRRIEAELWAKLLYNCLLNPLGALLGVPYGELGTAAPTRAIMEEVARELFRVMGAAGRTTHWADADAYLQTFYNELLPPTAAHESSMLQDLSAGRPTEIDALTGAVVRLGASCGVETRVCEALTRLIHAAEQRGRTAGASGQIPTSAVLRRSGRLVDP